NMQELALKYADFTVQVSYKAWGSDHAPFLSQNVPAVLTIQSEFASNPNYHQVSDLMDIINKDLCQNILRLNAAAMYLYGIAPESAR
ncbi:MAG: M28 family peptidase, partial [Candidatus Riflebacteria bacterium]|nr:M28 family peptidase [Candidatus Riflebacteria bacterium]